MRVRQILPLTAIAVASALALSGCAPEGATPPVSTLSPGELRPEPQATEARPGKTPTGNVHETPGAGRDSEIARDNPEELEGIPGRQPAPAPKNTSLPSSFPSDAVPLPREAQVYDAGERGAGAWFVVLKYPTLNDARAAVDTLVAAGDFTASQDDGDTETIIQVLDSPLVSVDVFAYLDDGNALVNFEVASR